MCDYHARPISRKYHRDPSTGIAPRGNENGAKTCTIDHPGRRKRVPSRTSILRISFFTPFESLPRYKRRTISRTVHNILRARECIREKRKGIRRRDEVEISDDALLSFFFFSYVETDMTAMPESFNFTKGVHRHVYLALLERVEPGTIRAAFRGGK